MNAEHPEPAELAAFGLGKLDEDRATAVEDHVAHCDTCCQTLAVLHDDTFVTALRASTDAEVTDVGSAGGAPATSRGEDPAGIPAELVDHPRYRVLELVGRGGMGVVYRAEHRLMQRPVALKVINRELVNHPTAVERFHREVRAAAQLSHPNIVAAYDAEQAGSLHFLATEFVDGTNLAELVKRRGALPVSEACDYVRQAALGLEHAYQHGMVHRDIKPQNLMRDRSGRIKILDFGLAQLSAQTDNQEALTVVGSVMGTPDYLAPEQARDARQTDIRSDIYSLGCTLYFLLSGQAPFPDGSALQKITAHAEQPLPSLTKTRNDVSPQLLATVAKLTAKSPQQRYQTPAEVAAALEPLARDSATPLAKHGGSGPPKRALIAAAAAALLLLLAGVFYIVTDRGRVEFTSDVDDVQVEVMRGGESYKVIDLSTESTITWLPSDEYQVTLRGDENNVELEREGFTLHRGGEVVIRVRRIDEQAANKLPGNAQQAGEAGTAAMENFVKNSGFEQTAGAAETSAAYWLAVPQTLAAEPLAQCQRSTEEHRQGEAAGVIIKPEVENPLAEAGFLQTIPNLPGGQTLKLSGFVKTRDVEGSAAVKLRLVDPQQGPMPIAWCETESVSGTTDWQRVEATIAVPSTGASGELGLVIQGTGTVWFDEILLERTQEPQAPTLALRNGEFEKANGKLPASWMPMGMGVQGITFELVQDVRHGGEASGTIRNSGGEPNIPYNFRQELSGPMPVGETMRLTGWVKTEEAPFSGVAVQLLDAEGQFVDFHTTQGEQPFSGTEDWQRFELTFEIPEQAQRLAVLAMLQGEGQAWFDDFELVKVTAQVKR